MSARAKNGGFTLVEVLMAIVITVIVGLAVVRVIQSTSQSAQATLQRLQAGLYLDQIHNQLQRSAISTLAPQYRQFPQIITNPRYSATVDIQPLSVDATRQATITIRWATERGEESISQDVTLVPRWKTSTRRGTSLVELLIAMALAAIAAVLLWKGINVFRQTMSQQLRLQRMNDVLTLVQEISQTVRQAKRIASVGPDHLEVEAYDFGSFGVLDPRLLQTARRIRYQYRTEGGMPAIVREISISTTSAAPDQVNTLLKTNDLLTPTESNPFFFASYLVGDSTVAVRLEFALNAPYSTERWVPIKDEVYVQTEQ